MTKRQTVRWDNSRITNRGYQSLHKKKPIYVTYCQVRKDIILFIFHCRASSSSSSRVHVRTCGSLLTYCLKKPHTGHKASKWSEHVSRSVYRIRLQHSAWRTWNRMLYAVLVNDSIQDKVQGVAFWDLVHDVSALGHVYFLLHRNKNFIKHWMVTTCGERGIRR
jgi:hypothetical protein